MINHYSIYYDMQKNSFFRINKQTGDSVKSYLNGDDVPKFEANVTGFLNRRRRTIHGSLGLHKRFSPRKHSPLSPLSPRSSNQAKINFQTIDNKAGSQNEEGENKMYDTIAKDHVRKKHHSFRERQVRSIMQRSSVKGSQFQNKAQKYQKLLALRFKDNHSPLKNIDGSEDKKDILEILCIRRQDMSKTIDIANLQHSPNHKKKIPYKLGKFTRVDKINEEFNIANQIKKEKKFMSQTEEVITNVDNKMKSSSIERDRMRRENLKKLEKQMIMKNQKEELTMLGFGNL